MLRGKVLRDGRRGNPGRRLAPRRWRPTRRTLRARAWSPRRRRRRRRRLWRMRTQQKRRRRRRMLREPPQGRLLGTLGNGRNAICPGLEMRFLST